VYRELGLTVRRTRRKRLKRELRPRPLLTAPGQEWSIDFASDVTVAQRRIRVFNILDSFTKQSLGLQVDTSFPSRRVTRVLNERLPSTASRRPFAVTTARHFLAWAIDSKIDIAYIRPGKPTENAYAESFNGRLRDECLNTSWFWNLFDARRKIGAWQTTYNRKRPHSALVYPTPEEFAQRWKTALPSPATVMAEPQPPQGDPGGLRFAPALTRPQLCRQNAL
jgi:putative transposase